MSWQHMTKTQDVGMLKSFQGDKGLQYSVKTHVRNHFSSLFFTLQPFLCQLGIYGV